MTTLIYCADGNRRLAQIAIDYGFKFGAQLPRTIYHKPYFVDQDWKKPNRDRYMAALAHYRPALASVLDFEYESQLPEVLSWAAEAAEYVTDSVIIIPKVIDRVSAIPLEIGGKPIRLGYSVPKSTAKFGGTQIPVWDFAGRPVHLLGGSPIDHLKIARYLDVRSADGNLIAKIARHYAAFFTAGDVPSARARRWPQLREVGDLIVHDAYYLAFTLSCINVRAAWTGAECAILPALPAALPQIRRIANQYKQELGFVRNTSLLDAIERRELMIARYGDLIVGFVHFRRRKDGLAVIYSIAVDRDRHGEHIGAGLLCAVPRPTRLKCTADNPANGFYAANGFTLSATEPGRSAR